MTSVSLAVTETPPKVVLAAWPAVATPRLVSVRVVASVMLVTMPAAPFQVPLPRPGLIRARPADGDAPVRIILSSARSIRPLALVETTPPVLSTTPPPVARATVTPLRTLMPPLSVYWPGLTATDTGDVVDERSIAC